MNDFDPQVSGELTFHIWNSIYRSGGGNGLDHFRAVEFNVRNCSGYTPKDIMEIIGKDYSTYDTLELKVTLSRNVVFTPQSFEKGLEAIKRLTGWRFDGMVMRDHLEINFQHFQRLLDRHEEKEIEERIEKIEQKLAEPQEPEEVPQEEPVFLPELDPYEVLEYINTIPIFKQAVLKIKAELKERESFKSADIMPIIKQYFPKVKDTTLHKYGYYYIKHMLDRAMLKVINKHNFVFKCRDYEKGDPLKLKKRGEKNRELRDAEMRP